MNATTQIQSTPRTGRAEPTPEWLRPADCARVLGISLSHYWALVQKSSLPKPRKIGQRISLTRRQELLDAAEKLIA